MITRIQRVNIRYFPEPDAKAVTYTAMRKERKPMPNQQRNTINALIRQQCANYDRAGGGDCLLLDCQCPQLQSHSLICRYCRDAVLPADKLLYAEIMGAGGVKTCASCGKPFRAIANRAKYCDGCRQRVRNRQEAERKQKKRAAMSAFRT
mgnify:CR=1 FL=1